MALTPAGANLSDGSNHEGRAPRLRSSSVAPSRASAAAALFLLTSLGCADPGSIDSVSSPVIEGDAVPAGEYRSTVSLTTTADYYDPTTGALVLRQEPFGCTASIIAAQAILTAEHCTIVHGELVDFDGEVLEARRPIDTYITREGTSGIVSVSNFVDHPTLDVAVGYLVSQVPRPYAEIAETYDQSLTQGALVTVVGYGRDENGISGRKLKGTMSVSIRAQGFPWVGLAPGPTGQSACFGDSGGPVFDDARSGNSGLQFGIASATSSADCVGLARYEPTHTVFDWIQDLAPDVNEPEDNGNGNGNSPSFFDCAQSAGGGATGFGMILLGGLARRRRRNPNGHQPSAAPLS